MPELVSNLFEMRRALFVGFYATFSFPYFFLLIDPICGTSEELSSFSSLIIHVIRIGTLL